MAELKQVILVREDLKLSKGKLAAQVAHASVESVFDANKKLVSKWRTMGQKKVVLRVENLEELKKRIEIAKENDLPTSIIQDAGRTEIEKGTITCGAIGPAPENKIDKITNDLKVL